MDSLIPTDATQALALAVQNRELAVAAEEKRYQQSEALVLFDPDDQKKRKGRWLGSLPKKGRRWGLREDKPFKPLPYIDLPVGLSEAEVDQFLREQRLEDLDNKLQLHILEDIEPDIRPPSPPPVYDQHGNRLNKRETRVRKAMIAEYNRLVRYMIKNLEGYVPPPDWRPGKLVKKIIIPNDKYPNAPFTGVIIGARGVNHKFLQERTGCKIFIRGKEITNTFQSEEEASMPLHVHIEGDTEDQIELAEQQLLPLLDPESPEFEYARTNGMQQLAKVNGFTLNKSEHRCGVCGAVGHLGFECPETLSFQYKMANVVCTICGDKGHVASDCKQALEKHHKENVAWKEEAEKKRAAEEEYAKLMEELGGEVPKITKPPASPMELLAKSNLLPGPQLRKALPAGELTLAAPADSEQPEPEKRETVEQTDAAEQPEAGVMTANMIAGAAAVQALAAAGQVVPNTTRPIGPRVWVPVKPAAPKPAVAKPPNLKNPLPPRPAKPPRPKLAHRAHSKQPAVPGVKQVPLAKQQIQPPSQALVPLPPTGLLRPRPLGPGQCGCSAPRSVVPPPPPPAASLTRRQLPVIAPSDADQSIHCPAELVSELLESGAKVLWEMMEDTGAEISLSGTTVLIAGPPEARSEAKMHMQAWLDVNSRSVAGLMNGGGYAPPGQPPNFAPLVFPEGVGDGYAPKGCPPADGLLPAGFPPGFPPVGVPPAGFPHGFPPVAGPPEAVPASGFPPGFPPVAPQLGMVPLQAPPQGGGTAVGAPPGMSADAWDEL